MREQPTAPEQFEVIIIGGSQAGLTMSYWLNQHVSAMSYWNKDGWQKDGAASGGIRSQL
jgi:hypothetical protein